MTCRTLIGFTALAVVSALAASTNAALLLNEIYVNPPDTDSNNEYAEILSTTGVDSLSGVWLLEIEGDSTGAGVVDNARDLSALSFGTNGLLVLGEGYGTSNPWGITNPPTGLADLNRSPNATMENGTISFLLVNGFTGQVTDDLDTDDDGTLNTTPWTSVIDSIGWTDGGASDRIYAPEFMTVSGTADAVSRIFGDTTANSAAAWCGGDIQNTDAATDPDLSLMYDLATVGNAANRTANSITPGAANVPEPGTLALGALTCGLLGLASRRRRFVVRLFACD